MGKRNHHSRTVWTEAERKVKRSVHIDSWTCSCPSCTSATAETEPSEDEKSMHAKIQTLLEISEETINPNQARDVWEEQVLHNVQKSTLEKLFEANGIVGTAGNTKAKILKQIMNHQAGL